MTEPSYSMEPVDSLISYPGNARRGDVAVIRASLETYGQYKPIVVQLATRYVLVGNHTLKAAADLRWETIEVRWVDCDDEQARKINLIDNRSADLGDYDDQALSDLLESLQGNFDGTGYDEDYLVELREKMADDWLGGDGDGGDGDGDGDGGSDTDAGTLLALADVSAGEPTRMPAFGTTWKLGRHLLVVARLSDEHFLWRDYLEGRQFCPYPEPYITASTLAEEHPLLLVQPNRYLAGHLLDKHEVFFPDTVEQVK